MKSEQKPVALNYSALDALILPEEKKRAILAVLEQHTHATTIFEKWGLGKVMEYGRGMTMLFHGSPGTGKTFATHCIAEAVGKKVFMVDNAKLQSSTPGEMERNIIEVFRLATGQDQVLVLDECDSLLMSRNHVGMVLGSEINTLLKELEKFEGICILTTNRIAELDTALERRISLIVKFPKPALEQRKAIWDRFLPEKLPLDETVDREKLYALEITGGLVKNVVLNAARFAAARGAKALNMGDFSQAIASVEHGARAFEK